jgi:hypothetical protein
MKKLLATSALVVIAMTSAASAQSVLERVLGQIDNASNLASVNGTFANIAENIGGTSSEPGYTKDGVTLTEAQLDAFAAAAGEVAYADSLGGATQPTNDTGLNGAPQETDDKYTIPDGEGGFEFDQATYDADVGLWDDYQEALDVYDDALTDAAIARSTAISSYASDQGWTPTTIEYAGVFGVDGSINTTITGISDAVAQATEFANAGAATAYEFNLPTVNIGDLSTTALGAVNTGEITLGVNSAVDEAKTTSTQAVSSVMNQLGGSDGTGALVLNVASNMTGVNGSITTVMSDVNGAIASAATTALGAVNTGTIVSGVDAAVQGIVGVSGQ